ncbi:MAG TPA: ferric reductase-like transmembrane domain-containing protein [Candidatus Limnocylindrales bacterium]|nr:ferric reductase-like transmembrane domain-containing protein [Candidatus Limnocylindrales bacterium]
MNSQLLWFATRGAGTVSLILATIVVCLGILTVLRWQTADWPRFLTAELHRNLALLSIVFLAIHIVTAVVDPFANMGFLSAIVPFVSPYRPLWIGIGVISIDLGLAVVVTSLLRAQIGEQAWRVVHWAAYGAWPLAVLHSIGAGSDAGAIWMLGVDVVCIGAVVLAVIWRLAAAHRNRDELAGVADGTLLPPPPRAGPGRAAFRDR